MFMIWGHRKRAHNNMPRDHHVAILFKTLFAYIFIYIYIYIYIVCLFRTNKPYVYIKHNTMF